MKLFIAIALLIAGVLLFALLCAKMMKKAIEDAEEKINRETKNNYSFFKQFNHGTKKEKHL